MYTPPESAISTEPDHLILSIHYDYYYDPDSPPELEIRHIYLDGYPFDIWPEISDYFNSDRVDYALFDAIMAEYHEDAYAEGTNLIREKRIRG